LWRTFLLLYVGVAATMDRCSHSATAYRVLLELPADSDGAFHTARIMAAVDRARGLLRAVRDGLFGPWSRGTPAARFTASIMSAFISLSLNRERSFQRISPYGVTTFTSE
jgi:hypothetical protein